MTRTRQCPVCAHTWAVGQNQQHSCEKKLRERVQALEAKCQGQADELEAWRQFGEGCATPEPFDVRIWPNRWPHDVNRAAFAVHLLRESFVAMNETLKTEPDLAAGAALRAAADQLSDIAKDRGIYLKQIQRSTGLQIAELLRGWATSVCLQAKVAKRWAFLHRAERLAQQKD